jgi:hypothetical protein
MPRQERLWKAQDRLELADTEWLCQQQVQDAKPVGFGKCFEETVEGLHGLLCLSGYAHRVLNPCTVPPTGDNYIVYHRIPVP